ncbi:MAG: FYDLN acid domain-containing protein [Micavibrio sp.]|nr:FYDLN acid domain-containing protein [Micavibrio sp.]
MDIRGLKRVCVDCGTRFYDMNKRPIVCPNCKAEFSGEIKIKSRRGRNAAVEEEADVSKEEVKKAKVRDDELEEDDGAEIVSLDDVDDGDSNDDDDEDDEALGDLDDDLDDLDDALGDLDDIEPDADLNDDDD